MKAFLRDFRGFFAVIGLRPNKANLLLLIASSLGAFPKLFLAASVNNDDNFINNLHASRLECFLRAA